MTLIKEKWTRNDINEFEKYLFSLANVNKVEWTRKIVNTARPVLAIPTPTLRKIAKQIMDGDYLSFLDLKIFSSHESMMIYGIILSKISNFKVLSTYLDTYALNTDCWATCDILSFKTKHNEQAFLDLSHKLVQSNHEFARRIGIIILFKLVDLQYIHEVFKIVSKLKNESAYYVNMAVSWLMCDCFIKERDLTLRYLSTNPLNDFVKNKFVSKCRDSFRISTEDKEMLKSFKCT